MILLAGQLSFIRSMADGGWRLVIDLGENPPLEELNKCKTKAVFIGMSLAELTEEEKAIMQEATDIEKGKTETTHTKQWFD